MNKAIYEKLMDEESRHIFENRYLFSKTGDPKFIRRIIEKMPEYHSLTKQWRDKPVYIFGAGKRGRFALENYNLQVVGFIDNDKTQQGGMIKDKRIFGIEEIDKNANIFIANLMDYDAIESQLTALGFGAGMVDNDLRLESFAIPRQYFDLEYLKHDPEESFVDAGALDGDSSFYFHKWCRGKFRAVFCFEPEDKSFRACVERLAFLKDKVRVIKKGLWEEEDELSFSGGLRGSSKINRDGASRIAVTTLDKELGNEKITFIKMDIEGAEIPALKGGEMIIRDLKPKLAISVYHRPEDIIEIPELLLQYRSDYQFFLRHYSIHAYDTVLYAI